MVGWYGDARVKFGSGWLGSAKIGMREDGRTWMVMNDDDGIWIYGLFC